MARRWQSRPEMDDLVRRLLTDLAYNLDRLADQLEPERPALARSLRRESVAATGEEGARDAPTRRPLRPVLYEALDAGVLPASRFDRLMVLEARARRRRAHPR